MLSHEVVEFTRAYLEDGETLHQGQRVPVLTLPYGDGEKSFEWYRLNHASGWVVVSSAQLISPHPNWARWVVNVEAVGGSEAAAREMALRLVEGLHGTPYRPTPFQFQGDTPLGLVSKAFRYTLSFVASLRHKHVEE